MKPSRASRRAVRRVTAQLRKELYETGVALEDEEFAHDLTRRELNGLVRRLDALHGRLLKNGLERRLDALHGRLERQPSSAPPSAKAEQGVRLMAELENGMTLVPAGRGFEVHRLNGPTTNECRCAAKCVGACWKVKQ